jgi:exodeoxyribonuclease V alpha subunit
MLEGIKPSSRLLDRQFANWLVKHFAKNVSAADRKILQRLAEAASYAIHLKHSGVDVKVAEKLQNPVLDALLKGVTTADVKRLLTPDVLPLVASASGQYFWLQKYHSFEKGVAEQLQRMAAEKRLEIVTGGPGTGKTWTAAQRIQEERAKNSSLRILLAAPTGKAANTMTVALANAGLAQGEQGLKATTLHALLGLRRNDPKPARHAGHLLAVDLLVIDEASMVDLPMMFHLLQAIPPHATLLLLGDKDQLASVEAGSVLHEICEMPSLSPVVITLSKNWRSEQSPEIGLLASALNNGTVPEFSHNQKVRRHLLPNTQLWQPPWLDGALQQLQTQRKQRQGMTIRDILQQQKQFQILCALREGPQGVNGINDLIEKQLIEKKLLPGRNTDWYEGKPVMITQNDHERKLYNGDVGRVLDVDGTLKACFRVDNEVKTISRAQMPTYETCYAITVHKSQGSEYDHVLIVLPADPATVMHNPVLTRELLYTAVTRARESIDLWCGDRVLEAMASKKFERMSGLGEMLE